MNYVKVVVASVFVFIVLGAVGLYISTKDESFDVEIEPVTASYDSPFSLSVGDEVYFADGFRVQLTSIDDSRCKPDVQCIWAGELSATLTINGGPLGEQTYPHLRIGEVTGTSASSLSLAANFHLVSITPTSATLRVRPFGKY
jgi:hypothetical protein